MTTLPVSSTYPDEQDPVPVWHSVRPVESLPSLIQLFEGAKVRISIRGQAIEGSSSSRIRQPVISARPTASICCSPPLSVSLRWLDHFSQPRKEPKDALIFRRILLFISGTSGQDQVFHDGKITKDPPPSGQKGQMQILHDGVCGRRQYGAPLKSDITGGYGGLGRG